MPNEDFHLSDQELLLAADGELATRRAAQVRAHLAACWDCRARIADVEGAIAGFVRAYRQTADPKLPSIAGARALLKAQLAELSVRPPVSSWRRLFHFATPARVAVSFGLAIVVMAVGAKVIFGNLKGHRSRSSRVPFETALIPDRRLTPGATRPVAITEVCSMAHEDVVRTVPTPLRKAVLQEYQMANATTDSYEIDYLIAPGLGGAEDIHNLWPESYRSSTWNARVKDDLEERLHEMVCAGQLDLTTAQRDIATDWIAAYKKYFHTDRPVS